MREIKFRAWDKMDNEMIFDIVYNYDGQYDFAINRNPFSFFILHGGFEVMQYTGLKDRNGVEIYEGDILIAPTFNAGQRHMCVVVFENAGFKLKLISPKEYKNDRMLFYESYNGEKCEVIGNIYQNKELFE